MGQCCVYGCYENSSKKSKFTHHRFPKAFEKSRRQLWLKNCGRHPTINLDLAVVCSKHFSDEQYERNLKYEMGFTSQRKLKSTAFPDVNLHKKASCTTSSGEFPLRT